MSTAWFIGRSQWKRRWLGLIGLGLLAGLIAGVVMASFAGIRRTSSTLDRLIAESRLPGIAVLSTSPAVDLDAVAARLRDVPGVVYAGEVIGLVGREDVEKNWWIVIGAVGGDGATPVMVAGREPDPAEVAEVAVSRHTAEKFGLDVGSTFTIGFYSADQFATVSNDTTAEPTGPRPTMTVVGVYLDPRDVERSATSTGVRATPAFAEAYAADTALGAVSVTTTGRDVTAAVIDAVDGINEELGLSEANGNTIEVEDQLQPARDAEDESRNVVVLGLVAFALAALLAGVVAHGQALRRWMSRGDATQAALTAMGATRVERRLALAVAVAPHVVLALVVAVMTAWLMSPLFPIGVLRDSEPDPGLRLDGLVVGIGCAATAVVLSGLVLGVSVLAARRGVTPSRARAESPVVKAAERASAPLPVVVGLRYAIRPGRARVALPVRTAVTAAVVGIAGLVAMAIFTSSLDRLESTPARFGVPWDLSMELLSAPNGVQALGELVADPRISDVGVAAIDAATIEVDGVRTGASVLTSVKGSPLIVLAEGRIPATAEEVALGPQLLDEIDKSVGDTVAVTDADGSTVTQTIVGAAYSLEYQSTEFNSVAMYASTDESVTGPGGFALVVVRFADGVDEAAVAAEIDARYPFAVMNESYPYPPAEVINLAQLNALPRALALFLAFLALASLTHALLVTGRARRRDLGVLRALGFTRRQTAAVLVWTTAAIVAVGVALGIPIGLLAGATGWRLVAGNIFVGTDALVPVGTIALVAVVAVVSGVLVAGVPARGPMRMQPADALRSE